MIVITLVKRHSKIIGIRGVGHADCGDEDTQKQVCAAISALSLTLASRLGQKHALEAGSFSLRIPSDATAQTRCEVDFAVHGFEQIQGISPENVHIRTEYQLPLSAVARERRLWGLIVPLDAGRPS